MPRGKGPDVFIYPQDRLGGWVEAGNTIEPIDFFLEDEVVDRFIPTTMEAMTYQDTIYGLPLNFKVITQIYNKKLVKTPPKTSASWWRWPRSSPRLRPGASDSPTPTTTSTTTPR